MGITKYPNVKTIKAVDIEKWFILLNSGKMDGHTKSSNKIYLFTANVKLIPTIQNTNHKIAFTSPLNMDVITIKLAIKIGDNWTI
jgi:hypothetical protein